MAKMKIVLFYDEEGILGKLTKFFTGSYCYHIGFLDEVNHRLYDMHLIRRRRSWYDCGGKKVEVVKSPVYISSEYMEKMLDTDNNTYGFTDYLLFSLRWVYHLFGKSTPNAHGVICSELVYNDLKANGWDYTFTEVPSPADFERVLLKENKGA